MNEPLPHNCDEQGREQCCYCWAQPAAWRREYVDVPGEDHICDDCKKKNDVLECRDRELLSE